MFLDRDISSSLVIALVCFYQVNGLSLCNSDLLGSCADDGSLRLWSLRDREQALQFQVKDQVWGMNLTVSFNVYL